MFQRYGIVAQNESTHRSLSLKASVLAILLCSLFGANAVAIKFTLTGNILIALALIGSGIFTTQFNKNTGDVSGPGRR